MNPLASGKVTVRSGGHTISFDAGEQVSSIRNRLAQLIQLSPETRAFIGTNEVAESYVTQPGDTIVFIRKTGDKGIS